MSGTVHGSTPWMREALRQAWHQWPAEMAAAEAGIPDGMFVSLICGGRPRPLGAVLVRGNDQVARVEPAYHSVMAACHAVVAAGKVTA